MLDLISEGILEHLKNKGLDVSDIDFNALVDRKIGSTTVPKVNVSIDEGTHQKVTMNTFKQIPVIAIYLCVQNLKSERESRFAAYKLMGKIVDNLLIEKLDLPLQDALTPVRFQNVTDEQYAGAGFSLYQIDFTCSFNYTKELADNIDEGSILEIINTYYVGDEEHAGIVNLVDIDAGGAFSSYVEKISGGSAGTKDYIEDISGGDAETT
ncbi:MAG: hypothetical protein MIO92_02925 [Methanosarcinaceae archaeon]|nr:hypothetical protein [Methanosarcinaceae archaeon]